MDRYVCAGCDKEFEEKPDLCSECWAPVLTCDVNVFLGANDSEDAKLIEEGLAAKGLKVFNSNTVDKDPKKDTMAFMRALTGCHTAILMHPVKLEHGGWDGVVFCAFKKKRVFIYTKTILPEDLEKQLVFTEVVNSVDDLIIKICDPNFNTKMN